MSEISPKKDPARSVAASFSCTSGASDALNRRLTSVASFAVVAIAANIKVNKLGADWSKTRPKYSHLTNNRKRAQLAAERWAKIEHENKLLLRKMTDMRHAWVDSCTNPTVGTYEFKPGVRLNRFQAPMIDHCISSHATQRGAARAAESLNGDLRRRELIRITRENLGIVSRIQSTSPSYSREGCRRHAEAHDRLMAMIKRPSPHAPPLPRTHIGYSLGRGSSAGPSASYRRVFTPESAFEPLGANSAARTPGCLLERAPASSASLLLGIAAGFLPGARATLQPGCSNQEEVRIAAVSICRRGLILHLSTPCVCDHPAGSVVKQEPHKLAPSPPRLSSAPARAAGGVGGCVGAAAGS